MRIKLTPLYPKQEDAIFTPARFALIEGSTKSGKTVGMLNWQLVQCLTRPGIHRWAAPSYFVSRIAFRRAAAMFQRTGRQLVTKINESTMEVFFVNGSIWQFKSAHKPDLLYGEECMSVVMDEASRCPKEAWDALYSTLVTTGGPARLIGNVTNRNWFFHLCRKAQAGEPDHLYTRLTAGDAVDAGVMSEAILQQAERDMPHEVYRALYWCEVPDDNANPFGHVNIELCRIPAPSTQPPVVWGIDVARKQDWFVIIGLDPQGNEAAFHRFQLPWEQALAFTRSVIPTSAHILMDATGVGDAICSDLQRTHPNTKPFVYTQPSKQALMERLALTIQRSHTGLYSGPLVEELRSFERTYTSQGKPSYNAPDGAHDDCVNALALAIQHGHALRLIRDPSAPPPKAPSIPRNQSRTSLLMG